jgi:hypothetical protein
MLLLGLAVLVLLVAATLLGHGLLRLLGAVGFTPLERAFLWAWTGVALLVNLLLALALLVPLRLVLPVLATATIVGGLLTSTPARTLRALRERGGRRAVVAFGLVLAAATLYAARGITHYDTGLYHATAALWLSEHGVVPGLGLLHSRLGFGATWFTLPALFDAGVFDARMMTVGGALVAVLLLSLLLVAGARVVGRRAAPSDGFALVAILLVLPVVGRHSASASNDLPAAALLVLAGWSLLLLGERRAAGTAAGDGALLVPLVLAVGATSIKLSSLPALPLMLAFAVYRARRRLRVALLGGALVVVGLAPAAVQGLVTTGCAFYPLERLCVAGPSSLGAARAAAESLEIRDWARWYGPTPAYATDWNWVGRWLRRYPAAGALSLLAVLSAAALLLRRRGRDAVAWVIAGSTLGGLALGYLSAPSLRFFIGFVALAPALLVARKLPPGVGRDAGRAGTPGALRAAPWVAAAVVAGIAALSVAEAVFRGADRFAPAQVVWPRPLPEPEALAQRRAANFDYRLTVEEEDRCWAAPLPCAPLPVPDAVVLRDPARGLRAGFAFHGMVTR